MQDKLLSDWFGADMINMETGALTVARLSCALEMQARLYRPGGLAVSGVCWPILNSAGVQKRPAEQAPCSFDQVRAE